MRAVNYVVDYPNLITKKILINADFVKRFSFSFILTTKKLAFNLLARYTLAS